MISGSVKSKTDIMFNVDHALVECRHELCMWL